MDLDTYITTLNVLVDDWYKKTEIMPFMKRHAGPRLQMSDSEVLTVAIAGQWQVGVPWRCSPVYANPWPTLVSPNAESESVQSAGTQLMGGTSTLPASPGTKVV